MLYVGLNALSMHSEWNSTEYYTCPTVIILLPDWPLITYFNGVRCGVNWVPAGEEQYKEYLIFFYLLQFYWTDSHELCPAFQ